MQVVAETAKSPVVEITILFSATVWLLVKVNVFAALVVPSVCVAYVAVAGVSVAGMMPVPDRGTVCGLSAALSVKVSAPVSAPSTVGVKFTFTVHLAPAARVVPHVLAEIAKLPLGAMLLIFSVPVPLLVNVTVFAALVVLMTTLPKLKLAGDRVTMGGPLTLNVAVTDSDAFMVIEHAPVPVHAPLQPTKVEPEAGLSVRFTTAPLSKYALHAPGHVIPPGLLVTVPDPVPARVTVRSSDVGVVTVNVVRRWRLPPGVVTAIFPVLAPVGTMAVL